MTIEPDRNFTAAARTRTTEAELDLGLRRYMLGVYDYMAGGLALTGTVAFLVASSPVAMQAIFGSGLAWIIILAPVALVFFLSFRIQRMSLGAVQTSFWVYAALNGLSLSVIFVVYAHESIARAFFIAAATFAGMSLYGYTTRRDLSGIGSFLLMGLIGIVIASLVSMFLASTALQFAVSIVGVLVFTGLAAYDTQKVKEWYWAGDERGVMGKKSIMGALILYLDFINLFLFLLRFLGNRQ